MIPYSELLTNPHTPALNGLEDTTAKLFIIMCYHKDSEVVYLNKDKIESRWLAAKAQCGYPGGVEELTEYISNFLIAQNEPVWQQYVSCQTLFNEYQRLIIKPLKDDNDDDKNLKAATLKTKLVDDCDKLIERLSTYLDKIFEKDKSIIEHVKKKRITVESIASSKH